MRSDTFEMTSALGFGEGLRKERRLRDFDTDKQGGEKIRTLSKRHLSMAPKRLQLLSVGFSPSP